MFKFTIYGPELYIILQTFGRLHYTDRESAYYALKEGQTTCSSFSLEHACISWVGSSSGTIGSTAGILRNGLRG